MAERQYIGARYVPMFADPVEWDNIRQYEALTIVTHLGNSFTSRKPVPAGIDIGNADYWVSTGNYNEQVEAYRQQVEAVSTDVEKLKNQVDHPKYLFLGDSYASPVYGDWIKYAAEYLGLKSDEFWNLAKDSSNIASGLWLGYIKNWVAANPTEIKNVGTIVCGGGINDSDATNFPKLAGALQELISYCKNTFGNAVHVKLFYFGWALDTSPIIGGRTANYRSVTQTLYASCAQYGGEYVPGGETILHNREFLGDDGLHPNASGGRAIGWIVANGCKVGANSVNNYGAANVTVNGNTSGAINQYLCNNVNTIQFTDFVINFNSPIALSGDFVDVATVKLPYGNGMPATSVTLLLSGDGKLVNASCLIRIYNEKLQIAIREWDSAGTKYMTINCGNINSFSLTVNGLTMCD